MVRFHENRRLLGRIDISPSRFKLFGSRSLSERRRHLSQDIFSVPVTEKNESTAHCSLSLLNGRIYELTLIDDDRFARVAVFINRRDRAVRSIDTSVGAAGQIHVAAVAGAP